MKHLIRSSAALAAATLALGVLLAPVQAVTIDDIEAQGNSPIYKGTATVLVILAAFPETDVSIRYKVPFVESVSPNFYPDQLNSAGALGPALPDFRYDPIFEVSNYFRALSYGNLVYSAVYTNHVIYQSEALFGTGSNLLRDVASSVLTDAKTRGGKTYADYNLTLIVLPHVEEASTIKVTAWGNRVAVLNGYDNFRISDDPDEAPGLVNAFAQLLAFPESDFSTGIDAWDELETGGDDTDLMGRNGENSYAFTNPVNMIRAGWIDEDHVKPVERSGYYRLWPLRRENWNKDWDFDLYNILDDNPDFSDTYTDEYSPRVLKIYGYTDTDDIFYAWLRTEITYITQDKEEASYLRFKEDFSRSILVHKVENDRTVWVHANDVSTEVVLDGIQASAGIEYKESFLTINSSSTRNAACSITYSCRDYTTDPPSILVKADCVETSDQVITWFRISSTNTFNRLGFTLYNGIQYRIGIDNSKLERDPTDSNFHGWIGWAETGTNCKGASLTKSKLYYDDTLTLYNYDPTNIDSSTGLPRRAQFLLHSALYSAMYNNSKKDTPLAVCYAAATTGGVADFYFREQIYAQNHFLFYSGYSPYNKNCESTCTGSGTRCNQCAGINVCTTDSCRCATSYVEDPTDWSLLPADRVCCWGLGNASWSSATAVGNTCSCQDGWTGARCQNPSSDSTLIYDIDTSPDIIYEQGEFTLRIRLKVPPIGGTSVSTVTCTAVKADGTSVGTIFSGSYFGTGQTSTLESQFVTLSSNSATTVWVYDANSFGSGTIIVPEGWAPYINVSCSFSRGSEVSNYAALTYPYSFQIPIEAILEIEAPPAFRISNYWENGSVTVQWRDPVQKEFMPDLYYQIWYAVGRKSFGASYNISDYLVVNVTSGSNSYTFSSFLYGQWYTVRVAARTSEGGIGVTLPVYVKPSNLTNICSSEQTYTCDTTTCPSDRGDCLNGRCQCKGYYHGDNCELSGCYKTNTSKACSGHGTCTGTGQDAYCVCDDAWYKFFCDSLDWFDYEIPFEYPGPNNYFLAGTTRNVQWRNPTDSESDSVDYYYRYVDNTTAEDINDKEWTFRATYYYTDNVSSTDFTTNVLPEGQYGIYQILIKDRYYAGLIGMLTVNYYTPIAPTASPTIAPVTVAPSEPGAGGREDDGRSIGERLFTDFKAYSIGGLIALVALTIGGIIYVRAKLYRRRQGMLRLGKNEIEAAKSPQPASPQDDSQGINRSREVSGAGADAAAAQL